MGTEADLATAIAAGEVGNGEKSGEENHDGTDWSKGFDEGLKKRVDKFKTPEALAKSYVELETFASKAFQDMTPAEKEKYIKRLGLPESPAEYELSAVVLPKGLERTAAADADFKAFVHGLHLTKDQAKGLHEWAMKRAADGWTAAQEQMKRLTEERENALRTSWGTAYEANMKTVDLLIALGGDEFVQHMNSGPGKDAVMRKGLYAISKLMANETLVAGHPPEAKKTEEPRKGMVFDTTKSPELAASGRAG